MKILNRLGYETQKKTTTTIDIEDYKFMKKKNIKAAHAIRAYCQEQRALTSGQIKETIKSLREARDRVQIQRDNMIKVLREILNEKQFNEFLQKI